jgi:hypothetical protein
VLTLPKAAWGKTAYVGAGLWLSCLGLSLGGILEMKEKSESRQVEREMEPRHYSDQDSNVQ